MKKEWNDLLNMLNCSVSPYHTIQEVMRQLELASVILPPSIVENLTKSSAGLEQLCRLKYIYYGGGPLSPEIGDHLVDQGVTLLALIGSTEMGPFLSINRLSQYRL